MKPRLVKVKGAVDGAETEVFIFSGFLIVRLRVRSPRQGRDRACDGLVSASQKANKGRLPKPCAGRPRIGGRIPNPRTLALKLRPGVKLKTKMVLSHRSYRVSGAAREAERRHRTRRRKHEEPLPAGAVSRRGANPVRLRSNGSAPAQCFNPVGTRGTTESPSFAQVESEADAPRGKHSSISSCSQARKAAIPGWRSRDLGTCSQ